MIPIVQYALLVDLTIHTLRDASVRITLEYLPSMVSPQVVSQLVEERECLKICASLVCLLCVRKMPASVCQYDVWISLVTVADVEKRVDAGTDSAGAVWKNWRS